MIKTSTCLLLLSISIKSVISVAPVSANVGTADNTSQPPTVRALLIGVSEYPYLDPRFNLVGPRNDVILMSEVLKSKGIESNNIMLLTENLENAKAPTLSNIEDAVQKLLGESKAGDMVYLHFSGHGSQQPGLKPELEIDGLDETFLPADTKKWNNDIRSVENAITDNDVSQWLSLFKQNGVFVWLVFDSCHSGTMTRSQWRSRKVQPRDLGVPQLRSSKQDQSPSVEIPRSTSESEALHVSFFAAQTNEETPEMALPKRTEKAIPYGLFTYQIAQALRQSSNATYHQIAQQVIQNYNAQLWYGSRPMFAGDGLALKVFNNEEPQTIKQWPINRTQSGYEIPAGFLDQVGPQSEFIVLEKATNKNEDFIASASIVESYALTSQLDISSKQSLPKSAVARLTRNPFKPNLSIAVIPNPDLNEASKAFLDTLRSGIEDTRISWRQEFEPADIRIFATNDAIYFLTDGDTLPFTESTNATNSLATDTPTPHHKVSHDKEDFTHAITTIAKARNLMSLGTYVGSDALDAQLKVVRQHGGIEYFDGSSTPELNSGDQISLVVANYLETPLDITVLFVGSDYSIETAFPRKNQFNRFMEEEEKTIRLGTINSKTIGVERLIIIGTLATRTAAPSNYSFLSQSGLPQSRAFSSSTHQTTQLLMGTSFSGVRGNMAISDSVESQLDIKTITWRTIPR